MPTKSVIVQLNNQPKPETPSPCGTCGKEKCTNYDVDHGDNDCHEEVPTCHGAHVHYAADHCDGHEPAESRLARRIVAAFVIACVATLLCAVAAVAIQG